MRIESVYARMHIVYTSALLLCVVSLLATSLSSLYVPSVDVSPALRLLGCAL